MPSPVGITDACSFYLAALHTLCRSGTDFLGGAYALERYTGIARDTKDLDIFVRPEDCEGVLAAFAEAGFDTELTFPHWLAKARAGGETVDIIFSSGNGCARVDDEWFRYAVDDQVLDLPVRRELIARLDRETRASAVDGADARLCRGTLLSCQQYLLDVERWGYRDARLRPEGAMSEADIAAWTAAIEGPLPLDTR